MTLASPAPMTTYTNGHDIQRGLPLTLRMYGASDYATMSPQRGKKEPDFTEHGVWGIDSVGDLYACDWWFEQCETDRGVAAFLRLCRQWKPTTWWNEGGVIDKAIRPTIRKDMRTTNTFVHLVQLPSLQDKAVKLQSFHARATAGTVWFPIGPAWAEHVIDQLVKFPGGRWDDAADVCGLIGRGVDQMYDPKPKVAEHKPALIPFTAAWLEYEDDEKPKVRYFA